MLVAFFCFHGHVCPQTCGIVRTKINFQPTEWGRFYDVRTLWGFQFSRQVHPSSFCVTALSLQARYGWRLRWEGCAYYTEVGLRVGVATCRGCLYISFHVKSITRARASLRRQVNALSKFILQSCLYETFCDNVSSERFKPTEASVQIWYSQCVLQGLETSLMMCFELLYPLLSPTHLA